MIVLGFHIFKKIASFIYLLTYFQLGWVFVALELHWNFCGIFSIGGWLNLWMWKRANSILLLFFCCFFSSCGEQGDSSCGVWASNCCVSFLVAGNLGSRPVGFCGRGSWALERQAPSLCAYLLHSVRDILRPGIEPVSPTLARGFLQPGMPLCYLLYHLFLSLVFWTWFW